MKSQSINNYISATGVRPVKLSQAGPLVKVGSIPTAIAALRAEYIINKLRQAQLNFHFAPVPVAGFDRHTIINRQSYYANAMQIEKLFDAVLKGQVDIAVMALPELPALLPQGVRLAALTPSVDQAFALVTLPDTTLKSYDYIGVYSFSLSRQLRNEYSNFHYEQQVYNYDQALQMLKDKKWQGVVLPYTDIIYAEDQAAYNCERLSLQRVVPPAGQGSLAIVVSEARVDLANAIFTSLHSTFSEKRYKIEMEIGRLLSNNREVAGSCLWQEEANTYLSLYNPHLLKPFQRWACQMVSENNAPINQRKCYRLIHSLTGNICIMGGGTGNPKHLTLEGKQVLSRTDVLISHGRFAEPMYYFLNPKCQIIDIDNQPEFADIPLLLAQVIEFWQKGLSITIMYAGEGYALADGSYLSKFLVNQRIPFQLVTGVSQLFAGSANAGVPLIYAGRSAISHFIDANDSSFAAFNYRQMPGTLIFQTSKANVSRIVPLLQNQGLGPTQSVIYIYRPGHPEQFNCSGTLDTIVERLKDWSEKIQGGINAYDESSPAYLIVGDVSRMHEVLDRANPRYKPLAGQTILVPSIFTEHRREIAFQSQWEELGAYVAPIRLSSAFVQEEDRENLKNLFWQIANGTLNLPTTITVAPSETAEIAASKNPKKFNKTFTLKERFFERERESELADMKPTLTNQGQTWLVFMTVPAVESFFQTYLQQGRDIRHLSGCGFVAADEQVFLALAGQGIQADYAGQNEPIDVLATAMKNFLKPIDQVLVFKGHNDSDMLEMIFNFSKIRVKAVPCYSEQNIKTGKERLERAFDEAEYIAFMTLPVVNAFARAMHDAGLDHTAIRKRPLALLAANSEIAEALKDRGFEIHGDFSKLAKF